MRTHPDNCGYMHISMYDKGKKTTRLVHRVVLETYRGPCPDAMEALHRDNDKENNDLRNLRWGTKQENMDDLRKRNLICGPNSHKAMLTAQNVQEIRRLCTDGVLQKDIAKMFNIDRSAICKINTRDHYKWVKETKDESNKKSIRSKDSVGR